MKAKRCSPRPYRASHTLPLGIRRLAVSRQTTISKNPPREKPFYVVIANGGPAPDPGLEGPCFPGFRIFLHGTTEVLFMFRRNRSVLETRRLECLYINTGAEIEPVTV